jgi:hypothetical protein
MANDLESLIKALQFWGVDEWRDVSPRERAIVALEERKPEAVPALIQRLEELLDTSARWRELRDEVVEAWDAWYSEGRKLSAEHGFRADIEPYRTLPTASLPSGSEIDGYSDPLHLKQGIIEALHQLGDPRAGAVIVAALAERACGVNAARALRDIRNDQAVPALLDAAARVPPLTQDMGFTEILSTLKHYGLSPAQARERFDAETSPQGRVNLWQLLSELDEDGDLTPPKSTIRDSLVFLALDSKSPNSRASDALREMDGIPPTELLFSRRDVPPSPDIIGSAIVLAAHGRPPGYDHVLLGSLRAVGHTPEVTQAAEAILTQRPPGPDARELRLALELIQWVSPEKVSNPLELIRALRGLTAHSDSQISTLARAALLRDGFLFSQMLHKDSLLRQEALGVFDAIAGPDDRTRFTRYARSRRTSFWRKLLRR